MLTRVTPGPFLSGACSAEAGTTLEGHPKKGRPGQKASDPFLVIVLHQSPLQTLNPNEPRKNRVTISLPLT